MSVDLLFQFADGASGVVRLNYEHFQHATKGQWATMCPLLGRGGVATGFGNRGGGGGTGSLGAFDIVGNVCSMYETNAKGGKDLVAKVYSFPSLGGVSGEEIKSTKFEGSFRIFRARNHKEDSDGTWKVLAAIDNIRAGVITDYGFTAQFGYPQT